jgi:predicted ATPase/class 3 adenylate cyclase
MDTTVPLPTGTVTFLFTDIEESTRLWEQYPAAMRQALARHDSLLRHAIETHGGCIFKTVGDQFCTAFAAAPAALAAAMAAQCTLQAESWEVTGPLRVRMALHAGDAHQRERDYFGPPLNRVARLLAAGHGGQILLSQAAQERVRDYLPPGASLRDLGERRLRDLVCPEHVYQLLHPDLPQEFPPLRTLDLRPNNLPVQPNPLLGREQEVAAARALLRQGVRLLTLTGSGGTGKTRLGLQIVADLVDEFYDGVFFVPLAPIADPQLVASGIAQVLGVGETPEQTLSEGLKEYLRDRRLLLLLDNFEQLLPAAPLVAALLGAAPGLTVLVTSRAVLHVRGEQEFPVPPLAVPDCQHLLPLSDVRQNAAVELFVQRAVAVKPDFAVTHENAAAVVAICQQLDGLPLAIELAAGRTKLFSPPALLARLGNRLKVLTGGPRDLPERQQTLRSAIDWSYDLLDDREQQLFRQLSVFAGGCTLEAAEAVATSEGDPGLDVPDGLASLVDKSLVRQDEQPDGEPRFWMLETIREYARERLAASGEEEAVRQHHTHYFLQLAEHAEVELVRASQAEWLERLEREQGNLRAALDWSTERIEGETGLRLAAALWRFWYARGYFREGLAQLTALLSRSDPTARTATRARALRGAGVLAHSEGDSERARAFYEESLGIWRDLEDRQGIAAVLNNLGTVAHSQGDYERTRPLLEESLAIRRELGHRSEIAASLSNLALLFWTQGDYGRAQGLQEEALALNRTLGNTSGTASSLSHLAGIALDQGQWDRAQRYYEESLAIWRELRDQSGTADGLASLGSLAYARGVFEQAWALHQESLEIRRELQDKRGIANSLNHLARLAGRRGEFGRAYALLEEETKLLGVLQDRLGMAYCLECWAGVVGAEGQPALAARLFAAAATLRDRIGSPLPPAAGAEVENQMAAVRRTLGDEAFAGAWAEGQVMEAEQAIGCALQETRA